MLSRMILIYDSHYGQGWDRQARQGTAVGLWLVLEAVFVPSDRSRTSRYLMAEVVTTNTDQIAQSLRVLIIHTRESDM